MTALMHPSFAAIIDCKMRPEERLEPAPDTGASRDESVGIRTRSQAGKDTPDARRTGPSVIMNQDKDSERNKSNTDDLRSDSCYSLAIGTLEWESWTGL